jgi:primosomal protein N' (replication factor Y)
MAEHLGALLRVPVREVSGPKRTVRQGSGEAARGGQGSNEAEVDDDLGGAPVLVGTEAVLHRVRHAGMVAFLDFDQHLLAPRFGAGEECLVLLARSARIVGGRASAGEGSLPVVLVQTRLPQHESLVAAVRGDPSVLARSEMAMRRRLSLPPASAMALVSGAGAEPFARQVVTQAAPGGVVSVGGSGVEASDLGDGRILIRAAGTTALCDALARVPRRNVRVEVDPLAI